MASVVQALSRDRKQLYAGATSLILMTVAAYAPALRAGFIWDDDAMLTANPFVKLPMGLYYIWCSTALPDYFPLTSTSFWLEWRVWGMHASGYHLTNIFLHAASAVLLWRVLLRLKISGAWLAAMIFAVHPVNVESVAWITERKNTLSLLFCLLAVLWYLRFDSESRLTPRAPRKWYWLALLAFVLSLLAKTAPVMLPFVVLLCVWWRSRPAHSPNHNRSGVDQITNHLLRLAPFFLASLLMGLITIWFQTNRAIGGDVVRMDSFLSRLAGAGWAVWFYLGKIFVPVNLSFVYPHWEINVRSPLSWLPSLALALVLVIFWRVRNGWSRACLFGLGSFVLLLLPVLGFFNIYFQRYSLVADHWQYFPLIGILALVVGGSAELVNRLEARATPKHKGAWLWRGRVAGAALALALGLLSAKQTLIYADSETLWRDTLTKNPTSLLALNNLGLILSGRGESTDAKSLLARSLEIQPNQIEAHHNLGEILLREEKIGEAKAHYLRALEISPRSALSHYNLANALDREGKTEEALAAYRRALELMPEYPDAHNNLGCMLVIAGKFEDAAAHFQQALRYRPDYPDALNNLGSTLTELGRSAEAVALLRRAIELNRNYVDPHYNLANACLALGKPREAFTEFQITISLRPDHSAAHYKLGNLLLANGDAASAAEHYRAALRSQPESAEPHYQLATILVARSQWPEAVEHFRNAIRLKPDWIEALNNLAWLLATTPEPKWRDGRQAVELSGRAVELTRTNDASSLDTLAAGYAEAGQFPLATHAAQRAVELAHSLQQTNLAAEIQTRLQLYEAGRPFHSNPAPTR